MIKRLLAKLFVRNVRLGFATNSSSSHSLVYYAEPNRFVVDAADFEYSDLEFGWGSFIAAELQTKLCYGLLSMSSSSRYFYGDDQEAKKAEWAQQLRNEYGPLLTEITDADTAEAVLTRTIESDGYVDHQSVYSGYVYPEGQTPRQPREFLQILADPHVVVHGGNDNGGQGPHDFFGRPDVVWVRETDRPFADYQPYGWEAELEDLPDE